MTDYLDDTGLERFFDNIKDLMHGPSYQQVASYLNAHPESLNDPVADYLDENPTATIPNESITADKLASNSVTSEKIADGAVTTNDLANGAVTSAKIADGTIATSDLADSSVTTVKIANSTITTTKIADEAVTANKLASDAIPTMSTTTPGIAKIGAGLTMYNGAIELDADTTGISGAVEAWLDAHPEATTTVQDNSVTDAKLIQTGGVLSVVDSITELVEPTNVYNPNDVSSGYLDTSGTSHSGNYVYTNYYIPVSADDVVNSNDYMRFITAYDADKHVVQSAGSGSAVYSYTVPEGVYYIRPTTGANVTNFAICINSPAVYTPWFEPYRRVMVNDGTITDTKLAQTGGVLSVVNSITELIEPTNVYNPNDVSSGYLDTSGTLHTGDYVYTNYYIPVSADDVVNSNDYMRFIAAYDTYKNVVPSAGSSSAKRKYTVPEGVAYIRPSTGANVTNFAICINSPAVYTPWFEPYRRAVVDDGSVDTDAIADGAVTANKTSFVEEANRHNRATDTAGGYINPQNGNFTSDSRFSVTDYIKVSAGETIYSTFSSESYAVTAERGMRFVAAFDADGSIVTSAGSMSLMSKYVVPDGINYIRAAVSNAIIDYCCIGTSEVYEERGIYAFTDDVKVSVEYAPIIVMPKEICVAVGRTVEVYDSQVCLNADKFHFQWSCDVGYQFKRKFQIVGTSANIGSYTATLTLYNDNRVAVWQGTTTVKVVADGITSLKVCPIGDSLTNRKPWLSKVMELNSGIEFVGTR